MARPAAFRWPRRRLASLAVRVTCAAAPVVAGVAVSVAIADALPESRWWLSRVAVLASSAAAGLGAVLLADRAWRRMLPLAALLEMSLAFPDRAPSRLRVALRAGSPKRLLTQHDDAHADRDTHAATVLALAAGLTVHDRATRGHSERVRAYAELIADELGLHADDHDRLRWAALLHDIGKVTVPASTLNATSPLSDVEWELLRRHPEEGDHLTEPLKPWLGEWALAVAQHHERYDGTGYPLGLAGDELGLAGRIVAVADSFDAMTTDRSYSKAMLPSAAREQLVHMAGRQFDPVVVRAFLNVGIGRIRRIIGPFALIAAAPLVSSVPGAVRHVRNGLSLTAVALASAAAVLAPLSEGTPAPIDTRGRVADGVAPVATPGAPIEQAAGAADPGHPPASPSGAAAAEPAGSSLEGGRSSGDEPAPAPAAPCRVQIESVVCADADAHVEPSPPAASVAVHAAALGLVDVSESASVP